MDLIFTIRMSAPEEDRLVTEAVRRWAGLVRIPAQVHALSPGEDPPADSRLLLWDLDGGGMPPDAFLEGTRSGQILVLCASGTGKAIGSYSMHPAGFLKKPIRLGDLRRVLEKTIALWHDELERVDVLCGGFKRSVPLYDLMWAESSQHGTLLHTHCESIQTRETLRDFDARLPEGVFLRCQRSFIVNLYHVSEMTSAGVKLDDGSDIPVGRRLREDVQSACHELLGTWQTVISL